MDVKNVILALAESALNDSTGAVLALMFAGVMLSGDASVSAPAIDFLEDLAISTAFGVGFGVLLSLVVSDRRAGVWRIVFLSWTRETGVVAAALAGVMVGLDVPNSELIVTTVALTIVVTLGVQTTTKTWLGRRLGLDKR